MSFFEELKRRNVFRVAVAYVITAWLLLQVSDVFINNIGAPEWLFQAIVFLLAIGFPMVVIFSWVFEITPEGIRREKDIARSDSITSQTAHKLDRAIIVVLVLAVAYFIWESRFAERPASGSLVPDSAQTSSSPDPDTPGSAEPSIAVLPFADMSPDKDQEYFSDGIAEELLNLLVRVDGIKVASRTSAFSYKHSPLNLAEIASELQVDHVLEGSVRKADNRVRITAQLIDANSDRHLWSETYDRDLDDIFSIQDEIANAIVNALRSELEIETTGRAVTVETATGNLDAYESYLKARGLFIARSDLPGSIALFEQAVALDPEFARAWATLAANYSVMNSWGHYDRDYPALAASAVAKAMEINPSLALPWAVKGQLARNSKNLIESARHLDRAIELDPMEATNYLWRGINSSALGFQQEAISDYQRCLDLDPLYENCRRHLAVVHFILGHDDVAMRYYMDGAERGYKGMEWALVQRMTTLGRHAAVANMLWRWDEPGSNWPGKALIDAMKNPQGDHSRGIEQLLIYAETVNQPLSSNLSALAIFKAWHLVEPSLTNTEVIWLNENREFLRSGYFKPWAEKSGLTAYWKTKGFPPRCRPLDDEDYICE